MLTKYLLKHKKSILTYLLLNIFSVIILLNIYSIYGQMFSFGNSQSDYLSIGITFAIELIALLIIVDASAYLQFNISFSTSKLVKNALFDSAIKEKDNQAYISYIMNDMEIIEDDYYYNLLDLFCTFLQSAIFLFATFSIDIKYGLIVVILLLPTIFFQIRNIKVIPDTNETAMKSTENELGVLRNYFTSIIDIKTNNLTNRFNNKLDIVFDDTIKTKLEHNKKMVLSSALLMFSIYLLKAVSTIIFINDGFNLIIDISTVALLIGYVNNVGNPIRAFLGSIISIISTKEIQKRITRALSIDSKESMSEARLLEVRNLSINALSVLINDKSILRGLSYTFNKDTHYAIIGDNGSGKSTLFKSILDLIDHTGDIRLNNEIVDKKTIRKNIGYLPQKCNLINSTIRNNITMFDETISDDRIVEVVKMVNLEKLLKGEGIDRNVSNTSKTLSSGEIKRLCLARLLCRDYDVLLIDEGTSALDKDSTEEIERVLKELKDKIIISIIHKPEYLRYYDVVLKMNNGKLEEVVYE